MPKIKGRKYEVTLDDGRVISRQYAHVLLNKDIYNKRRYNTEEKITKSREYNKKWLEKFEAENGIPYWKHRKNIKMKGANNDNKESDTSFTIDKDI